MRAQLHPVGRVLSQQPNPVRFVRWRVESHHDDARLAVVELFEALEALHGGAVQHEPVEARAVVRLERAQPDQSVAGGFGRRRCRR